MTFIKEFKNTFLNPYAITSVEILNNKKLFISNMISSYLLILAFTILFGSVMMIFITPENDLKFNNYSFLMIGLLIPIYEELLFRLILRISVLNIMLVSISIAITVLKKLNYLNETGFLIIGLLIIFILMRNLKVYNFTKSYTYLSVIYISSISFGLLHLLNYDVSQVYTISAILYVVPKVFTGFVFSFLRLKYGILASIILHVIINSISYLLTILH